MKKLLTLLTALCMLFSVAALAENAEAKVFTFRNNVTFGMTMEEVVATEAPARWETDRERISPSLTFDIVEFEDVTEGGARVDLGYLFVDNKLVMISVKYEDNTMDAQRLKDSLTGLYGESVALSDPAVLGNAVYGLDDDGRLEHPAEIRQVPEMNLCIVLEQDEEDLKLTYIDMSAPYVSAAL